MACFRRKVSYQYKFHGIESFPNHRMELNMRYTIAAMPDCSLFACKLATHGIVPATANFIMICLPKLFTYILGGRHVLISRCLTNREF